MAHSDSTPEEHRGAVAPLRNLAPPWQPGQSGNPAGRPKGVRNRLSGDFLEALASDFVENGKGVIEKVRTERPAEYLRVIASLVPKEMDLDLGDAGLMVVIQRFGEPEGDAAA